MWTAAAPPRCLSRAVAALLRGGASSASFSSKTSSSSPPLKFSTPSFPAAKAPARTRPHLRHEAPRMRSPSSSSRPFTTTAPRHTKTVKPHRLPADLIPPYPYGSRQVYKQSNRGLYGQARIRFGNNVAEKHNNKSRRFWRPNVHVKALYSPALGARVKTRLTLRVLRTIRREGGIEQYLLKSKPARIKELGPGGWNLRWILMQTRAVQERLNEERAALGLPVRPIEDRDDIVHFALDYATPGPLSARSKDTLRDMRGAAAAAAEDAFVLGDDGWADVEGVEELSDEAEAELLEGLDKKEGAEAEAEAPDAKSPSPA